VFTVASRIVTPVVMALTAYLLFRGHYQPGGGFIAALVAGAGVAVAQLPRTTATPLRLQAGAIIGAGMSTAVAAGLIGLLGGSFLQPLRTQVGVGELTTSLSTSLIFDVGVFLTVLGLVVAALDRLARGTVQPGGNREAETAARAEVGR
jgi:multicomponent Na+:H+ antiporter subunit A